MVIVWENSIMEEQNLEERVRKLELELAKYKGFGGAVLFIGSCLGFVINLIIEYFKK